MLQMLLEWAVELGYTQPIPVQGPQPRTSRNGATLTHSGGK